MSRLPAAKKREQEILALELSTKGEGYDVIADRLGVSPRTAARRVSDALRRIPVWVADDLRRAEEHRLNEHSRRLNAILESAPDLDTELKVRQLLLAVQRERIQLFGLRLPAAVVVQHELSGQPMNGGA